MPSLNTLRTKGGVIVTIVIFLALIAFLVGDVSGLFRSNKLKVGEIDGKTIDYTEFLSHSDYLGTVYKLMRGTDALSAQDQDMIYNNTWDELVMRYSYGPGFEKLGINIGNAEQVDMVNGVYLSPVITSFFANPSTGVYDPDMMKMFLQNVSAYPANEYVWNYVKTQMDINRLTSKYMTLVEGGMFVTDLEVEDAMAVVNNRYDARVVTKNYSSIADSLVTVTDAQVKEYFNRHKESFRRQESRDVEYVVFDVMPSQQDYADALEEMSRMAGEMAETAAPMQYATLNSQSRPDARYYRESELSPELAAIAFGEKAGEVYGPALVGDTYNVSRLVETRMIPDSLGAKHILLQGSQAALADSLVNVIRKGADFGTLAMEYSMDQSVAANHGDLGRFDPNVMIPEFSNALIEHRQGEIFTVNTSYGLHVVQLTYKSQPVRKAQIATITYKVDPSAATMQTAYQRANNLVVAADKTLAGFREAASQEGLPKRNIHLTTSDRSVSGFENSREMVRWAFNGKEGEVSSIMELDGDYVVAAVTKVNKEGYPAIEEISPEIRSTLVKEAKAEMIAKQMQGESLSAVSADTGSSIQDANGIDPNSFFAPAVGMDLRFIGAVPAVSPGMLSKPVEGSMGVHVFEVSAINSVETSITAEDQRISMETSGAYYLNERTFQALTQESNVKDMRVRYF